MQVKFRDKLIDVIGHPVFIVGQNPGRQHKSQQTYTVWEGNRSSDLLNWVIGNERNLFLTNVCNYQEMTPERITDGLDELAKKIIAHRPKRIICLGKFAHKHLTSFPFTHFVSIHASHLRGQAAVEWDEYYRSKKNIPIHVVYHPSYIARFNLNRGVYKTELLKLIRN